MTRIGFVIETDGDRAVVTTERRGICAGCTDRSTCPTDSEIKPETITVLNPVKARPGDNVEIELPGHTELKVSLLIWAVPLAGLIAGAVAGSRWLPLDSDLATLIGAAAGLVLAFSLVVACDRRSAGNTRLVPRIVKVVNQGACPVAPGSDGRKSPREDRG